MYKFVTTNDKTKKKVAGFIAPRLKFTSTVIKPVFKQKNKYKWCTWHMFKDCFKLRFDRQ